MLINFSLHYIEVPFRLNKQLEYTDWVTFYLDKGHMVNIECGADGSCPYEYYCQGGNCLHDPVFPLNGYPIAIYCLFPFASAIVNTSGNSFGEFKVLFLMVALDYVQSVATTYCYPLTMGTALYNLIFLIFKRHP